MSGLENRAILVAEDEYWMAKAIRRVLIEEGATVVGPASSLETVIDLIETTAVIDGAILDVNLSGDMSFAAADLLIDRGVPFLFATGYDQSVIPSRFDQTLRCEKPVEAEQLCRRLAAAFA